MGLWWSLWPTPSLWQTVITDSEISRLIFEFITLQMSFLQSSFSVSTRPWKTSAFLRCLVSMSSILLEHSFIWLLSKPSILNISSRKERNSSATLATVSLAWPADCIWASISFILRVTDS
ncbi:hypothetical protein HW555_008232 [Spodoptera exigua]|uniref:Uncharacterized protein n=1 Tax=Spodoptera exigua TaxID=7107 RepID=A0A835L2X2_SPOEX|nr:hypothetical protein HW555_008232 [Spodoptera exigua]